MSLLGLRHLRGIAVLSVMIAASVAGPALGADSIPGPKYGPGPISPRPFQPSAAASWLSDAEFGERPQDRKDTSFKPKVIPGLGYAKSKTVGGLYTVENPMGGPDVQAHLDSPTQADLAGSSWINMPDSFAADPACVSTGRRLIAVYTYPTTQASNYNAYVPGIRHYMREANGKFLQESYTATGNARAARFKMQCASGVITVAQAAIPRATAPGLTYTPASWDGPDNVSAWVQAAFGAPSGSSAVKYIIFHDRFGTGFSGAGYGWFCADLSCFQKSGSNPNNNNTSSAVVYPELYHTHNTLHEIMHTMGAVQTTAPTASPAAHCFDGNDVMCYNDGTIVPPNSYSDGFCGNTSYNANGWSYSSEQGYPLDCNYNTYFRPTTGNAYLDSHWNAGGGENGFVSYSPSW